MAYLERRTKHLILRPLCLADYEAWHLAHTTILPAQNEWDRGQRAPEDVTLAKYKKLLSQRKKNCDTDYFYELGVFEKKSGALVGGVSAMNVVRGIAHAAYLGYSIFNPYWGRGYGKESVLAFFDIAFRDLKLHRLEAGVEPRNRRSIFLAHALKLRKEGLKRRAIYLRKAWQDLLIYSITCEELGIRWNGVAKSRLN